MNRGEHRATDGFRARQSLAGGLRFHKMAGLHPRLAARQGGVRWREKGDWWAGRSRIQVVMLSSARAFDKRSRQLIQRECVCDAGRMESSVGRVLEGREHNPEWKLYLRSLHWPVDWVAGTTVSRRHYLKESLGDALNPCPGLVANPVFHSWIFWLGNNSEFPCPARVGACGDGRLGLIMKNLRWMAIQKNCGRRAVACAALWPVEARPAATANEQPLLLLLHLRGRRGRTRIELSFCCNNHKVYR